jgi:hypothetical protein
MRRPCPAPGPPAPSPIVSRATCRLPRRRSLWAHARPIGGGGRPTPRARRLLVRRCARRADPSAREAGALAVAGRRLLDARSGVRRRRSRNVLERRSSPRSACPRHGGRGAAVAGAKVSGRVRLPPRLPRATPPSIRDGAVPRAPSACWIGPAVAGARAPRGPRTQSSKASAPGRTAPAPRRGSPGTHRSKGCSS